MSILEEQYKTDLERIKQLNNAFNAIYGSFENVSIGLVPKKEKKGKNESEINRNKNDR